MDSHLRQRGSHRDASLVQPLDRLGIDPLVESGFLDGGAQQNATIGAGNDVDVRSAHNVLNQGSSVRRARLRHEANHLPLHRTRRN